MKEFDFSVASNTVVEMIKDRFSNGIPRGKLTMFYCCTPSSRFKTMHDFTKMHKDGKLIGYKQRSIN